MECQFEEADAAGLSLTHREALMDEALEKIAEAEQHEEKHQR